MQLAAAVRRWGQPVGVEQARGEWSQLVGAAEGRDDAKPTATLLTCGDGQQLAWAVLVPLAELYEPQTWLQVVPVSKARAELGDHVRAVQSGSPRILERHHRAVAALMCADRVITAAPGEYLDVEELIRAGATVTLTHDPGTPHSNDPAFPDPGEPEFVLARATDPTGGLIGEGTGDTVADAFANLRRKSTEPPVQYSTESPPF
ncbi:hypothetical protein AVR91_0204340 [Amycolatopsis keratiniphila subsp. keratiniphila]|uniref:Uncharacterized protein n=1 Tax=Amycolatopsis keratiniphila subsp. keratiniphila TaxID=227715 RepID=A0A1W2M231_9PSEU|nr:hypothetical protein AVR91_0204340 [Amycolatopsis keratiniphila subsp. keratiniphila]